MGGNSRSSGVATEGGEGVYSSRTNLCRAGAYHLQSRKHCVEIGDYFLLTVKVASHRYITELRGQPFRSRLSVLPQATGVRDAGRGSEAVHARCPII